MIVRLTTPSETWHRGAMTVEIDVEGSGREQLEQAFAMHNAWAEMCEDLPSESGGGRSRGPTRRSGGGGSSGPTKGQWNLLYNMVRERNLAEEGEERGFIYSLATDLGITSFNNANQEEIDQVIQAIRDRGDSNESNNELPPLDNGNSDTSNADDPFANL